MWIWHRKIIGNWMIYVSWHKTCNLIFKQLACFLNSYWVFKDKRTDIVLYQFQWTNIFWNRSPKSYGLTILYCDSAYCRLCFHGLTTFPVFIQFKCLVTFYFQSNTSSRHICHSVKLMYAPIVRRFVMIMRKLFFDDQKQYLKCTYICFS